MACLRERLEAAAGGDDGVVPVHGEAGIGKSRQPGEVAGLARSAGWITATGRGEAGVVLLSGEPGIGKSRLLRELSARALADGWLVLAGRAYDTEGMPPYLPFVEVLRQYVHASSDDELRPLISAAPQIAVLLPEVGVRLGAVSPVQPDPESERYALFQAISEFLVHAANTTEARGLLICLEDIHWADRSSLLLLQHLARNMAAARLCLVGTYRTTGVDSAHPLLPILADLTRERLCEAITLAPLSPDETATLVATLTSRTSVSPQLIESVHDRTRGNPFFIEELVHHLQAEGRDLDDPALASGNWGIPEGVRHVIGSRLARLSPEDRRLLQAAAVLGDDFGQMFPAIARMLDVEISTFEEAVEDAVSAGMLRVDGEEYRFAHALIRDALLEEISLPRRQNLHLRAARAMEEVYARNPGPRLSAIAVHYRMAGPFADGQKAIEFSLRAGEAARQAFAYEEAQAHWEAALGLMEEHDWTGLGPDDGPSRRAHLLERLGDLVHIADWHNGMEYLEQGLTAFQELDQPEEAARVHSKLGRGLSMFGQSMDIERSLEHYRAAEAALSGGSEKAVLGYVYAGLATAAMFSVRTGDGLLASRRAMEIAEQPGHEGFWMTVAPANGWHLLANGQLGDGLSLMDRAYDTAARLNHPTAFFAAWSRDLVGLVLGDPADLERYMRRELASPRLAHAPRQQQVARAELGSCLVALGRLAEARRLLPDSNPDWLLDALIESKENWDLAAARFADEEEKFRTRGDRWNQWRCCWWRGQVYRVSSRSEDARELLTRAVAFFASAPHVPLEVAVRVDLALLCAETGHVEAAAEHVARCRQLIENGENWRGLAGRVALAQGAVAAASAPGPRSSLDAAVLGEAEAHFQRAVRILRNYTLPWDEAEALHLWGQALSRARRRSAALEKFDAAIDLYRCHGAGDRFIDRVEAEKKRALRTAPRREPRPDGLTEREVEVLGLLAAGASSKEIGEQLVLSVRTVERHIANIYLKTGTHGRAQATAYALSHGLVNAER
ncbi:MAG: AAA family ATPase [Dehalococcoidia bacterium]|nr:AAA family ATPase [Dehalococcoidia bacterium]NUQ54412.1 AAA family ATPase [Dehalococcoidia bacterium]